MKLHENAQLFKEAVNAAELMYDIKDVYIEKDYWVTYALKLIFNSPMKYQAVFKGGTSLSKCYNLIDRFSEDIDIAVLKNEGESEAVLTRKVRTVSKSIIEILPEININGVTSKHGKLRKTAHEYFKLFDGKLGEVKDAIILEVTSFGNAEPFTLRNVSCYLSEMMKINKQNDLIEKFELQPFKVQVLGIERTFTEKIMSLVRFSKQTDPYKDLAEKIRHIYDLYMLTQDLDVKAFLNNDGFESMIQKIGREDLESFNNNNEWLYENPSNAIIFKNPEETWDRIKAPYYTTFQEMVFGELPESSDLITMLKEIHDRLVKIDWNL
ncbi:MAG: nucleotidyl transferase AbiEii/AbiGii toxin family protein [Candidatus Delongbacteria bacterium]|nr:nucleotidyl transferase AbiEii/AbiGii toxin family protein [Candidatus Delongbacteria bacterium]